MLFIVVPLAVITVAFILVLVCVPLVYRRRRRAKQAAAASVGKPGVPVIFAEELNPAPGELRVGEETDDDEPVLALPPEYRAPTKSPTAGGDYKLLLVNSSDNEDEDDELNRQHQQSDSLRRRHGEPHQPQQQDIQSSLPAYAGPALKPAPSYTLAYTGRL